MVHFRDYSAPHPWEPIDGVQFGQRGEITAVFVKCKDGTTDAHWFPSKDDFRALCDRHNFHYNTLLSALDKADEDTHTIVLDEEKAPKNPQIHHLQGLTANEHAVYQSMVSHGVDPDAAYEAALDGVDIHDVRKRFNEKKVKK